MFSLRDHQPGFLIALTVTSWLRGANEGIDVDADVMLHRSEHLMYSARTALEGMEVDDTDFLRRVAGRVDAGAANSRHRVRVPRDAQGSEDRTAVGTEWGSVAAVDADSGDDGETDDNQSHSAHSVELEAVGDMIDEVVGATEVESRVGEAM